MSAGSPKYSWVTAVPPHSSTPALCPHMAEAFRPKYPGREVLGDWKPRHSALCSTAEADNKQQLKSTEMWRVWFSFFKCHPSIAWLLVDFSQTTKPHSLILLPRYSPTLYNHDSVQTFLGLNYFLCNPLIPVRSVVSRLQILGLGAAAPQVGLMPPCPLGCTCSQPGENGDQ